MHRSRKHFKEARQWWFATKIMVTAFELVSSTMELAAMDSAMSFVVPYASFTYAFLFGGRFHSFILQIH